MDSGTPVDRTVTILVREPERLRGYFERLGVRASAGGETVRVDVEGPDAAARIADQVRMWVAATGIVATVRTEASPAASSATAMRHAPDAFLDRPRLGDLLLRRGLIGPAELERALAESAATGALLGRVMIRRKFIFEDELARTLADQLDLPYVNLRVAGFDRSAAQLLPSAEGMRAAAIPVGVFGGRVRVAFADPSDERAKELVRRHVGDFTLAVADLSDVELAWRTLDPTSAGARVA